VLKAVMAAAMRISGARVHFSAQRRIVCVPANAPGAQQPLIAAAWWLVRRCSLRIGALHRFGAP
jgi:hypothetical protein